MSSTAESLCELQMRSGIGLLLLQIVPATAASSLSADQLREKAREEWLALRKGEALGRAGGQETAKGQQKGAGLADEKDGSASQRDKSKGKDDDFGL